jgi:hypothetical protein
MKNSRHLATILLTYMVINPTLSMDLLPDSASSPQQTRLTYDRVQKDVREKRLSCALSDIFGVDVQVRDDSVVFKGSSAHIQEAINRLNDFNSLREKVVPFNAQTANTQVCQSTEFKSWLDCMNALGINPSTMSNFAIHAHLDEESKYMIPYGPKTTELSFNQQIADLFIHELRKRSAYFDWICQRNNQILTETATHKVINYGLLKEHLCKIEMKEEPTEVIDISQTRVPLSTVLKRLTAAAGGDISLVPTTRLDHYQVRTIVLGRENADQHVKIIPTIEIVLDCSGSMGGANIEGASIRKIDVINSAIPTLLQQFRDSLNPGETLQVKVKRFNENLYDHAQYNLTYADHTPIRWTNIVADGGTDLTNVGKLLKLANQDERKAVVAVTDGVHEAKSSLDNGLEEVRRLHSAGLIAEPFFHRVGVKNSQNDAFFPKIASISAGSFDEQASMEQFCQKVTSKIPQLLESNTPIILSFGGEAITIRQPDAKPDVHTTQQTVSIGSVVTHRGVEHFVVRKPQPDSSTPAAASAAAAASSSPTVETAEDLKAQIIALQEKLAALNSATK